MVKEKIKVKREKSEYAVQAVSNAIDILELLGDYDHELSIAEVVSKLNLTRSNVNKLLANLEKFGYVEHNTYTGNFRLGVKTFQISQAYISKLDLIEVANLAMQRLKDALNESVYVGVLREGNVVYLDVIETDFAVRVMPRVGNIGPAYATAIGKAQLSMVDDSEVENLYRKGLVKLTEKNVDNVSELKRELQKVKEQGYALDICGYEEGVVCIAAPVLNFMGKVIAGLSISAPLERMGVDRINSEVVPILKEVAKNLSEKFGYIE